MRTYQEKKFSDLDVKLKPKTLVIQAKTRKVGFSTYITLPSAWLGKEVVVFQLSAVK